MFEKKYYFLSGLPRAGNTFFGSILNQNSKISVTANSPVAEILYRMEMFKKEALALKNFNEVQSFENISKNIFKNYFSNWKSSVIIDRSSWGTPDNLEILQKYCPNDVKIIILYRDVVEVLASFIKWSKENPGNFIDSQFKTVEKQCEYLMDPSGQIIKQLYSIQNLTKLSDKNISLLIKYDDLVENTEREIKRVYKFLNLRYHKHDYNNLKQFQVNGISYDDAIYGKNLHCVKKDISKSEYIVQDYLTKELVEKYKPYNIF